MVSYYKGMDCYGCNYMGGDMCVACAEANPDGRKAVVAKILEEEKQKAQKIFSIPDCNMPVVEDKIARLNKRAKKIGAEPIQIVVVRKWDKRIITDAQFGTGHADRTTMTNEPVWVIPCTDIQVIGKAPKLNGWTLVSVVEHAMGGVIYRKFPGVELEIPLEFRDVSPDRCDHCHTSRRRNETFIVFHAESQIWKVVGRTCLADFTGTNNPERIADYASALWDLTLSLSEEEKIGGNGGGNGGYYCAPIRSFLRTVAIYSARHGFVTSKQARESEEFIQPTGRLVFEDFFVPNTYRASAKKEFYQSVTDEEDVVAEELVDAAMQWGKATFVDESEENLTDYGHNMKLLLAADYVRIIDAGFVASVIPGYKRSITKKAPRLAGKGHVGDVGKKITTTVTIRNVFEYSGQYGVTNITTMEDDDGNILTWFAPQDIKMEVGKYLTMVAKVKRHDERNGTKSTVVTYPKFF